MRFLVMLAIVIATLGGTAGAQDPYPVMDMHSDIMLRVRRHNIDLLDAPAWPQVTIPTMHAGNVTDQVFAIWVDTGDYPGIDASVEALRMIAAFEDQMKKHSDQIALATTTAEADEIIKSGRIAGWLWVEGGGMIDDNLEMLRLYQKFGVRGMTLTWMHNLDWAGSSTDKENPRMGLTDFGRDVVQEMNRLHMIVDVSHVSDQTFYDAIEASSDPVIATHSGCRALADHPRNLSDEMLRALAAKGGVVGICALPSYLDTGFDAAWEATEARLKDQIDAIKAKYDGDTSNPEYREERRVLLQKNLPKESTVTIDTMLNHIDHAIKVAGPEHVALGSDFDGMWVFPVGFEKASKWQSVAEGLRKRGYGDDVIRGVMHDNARRVFKQVIGE